MNVQTSVSNELMADALNNYGVHFVLGGQGELTELPPVSLIIALAQSTEARLRLALIPLLLKRPDFAIYVRSAANQLPEPALVTLKCYFTAAMLLQKTHNNQIKELLGEQDILPDLFSNELAIPETGTPAERLEALALRHESLSDGPVNWLGTYKHAVEIWLKGLRIAEMSP